MRSGENGYFSVANADALYREMRVESASELSLVRAWASPRLLAGWRAHAGFARDLNDPPLDSFFSVNGDPLAKTSPLWQSLEPNNTGGAEVVVEWGQNVNLVDVGNDKMEPYVCECDGKRGNRMFQLQ